jgi:2-polyprenyl-3-methyl-5-hydroxy-6-metoxy-1,4-benzoquinol methylase
MDKVMLDTKSPTPSEIFNYSAQTKLLVLACPACGGRDMSRIRCLPDRYSYNVILITCPECTLTYLSETLTRAGYEAFYAGPYRQLVWAHRFPGVPYDHQQSTEILMAGQIPYAYQLEGYLRRFNTPHNGRVLDAGGSTGVVAHELSKTLGFASITVLDPAAKELELAKATKVVQGYLEDPIPGEYDLILCCETLDHLTKPAAALKNMRAALAPEGRLYVDVTNKHTWGVKDKSIKVDHPLYWTTTALQKAVRAAGFRVIDVSDYRWGQTWKTRMLCRTS